MPPPPPVPARNGEAPPEFADGVLSVVAAVPAGRVVSYGDVAGLIGRGGPRQVARVLAVWGGAVPWWRVVRADGTHAPPLRDEGYARLRVDRAPMRPDGRGVDMARARWDGR